MLVESLLSLRWLLIATSLAFITQPVLPCKCGRVSLEKQEQWADAIFTGKVKSIKLFQYPTANDPYSPKTLVVTIKVKAMWKGRFNHEIVVVTPGESTACGIDFKVGSDFLVLAKKTIILFNEAYTASHCESMETKYGESEIKALGKPHTFVTGK